jgi:hypothetical protein
LAVVVTAYASAGDPARARTLLDLLPHRYPSVVAAIADEVLGTAPPGGRSTSSFTAESATAVG